MASTQSSISLDDDTLLIIFDAMSSQIPSNSDRDAKRPLTHVRVASQVCRRWRRLLLASPRIWGRLVDLNRRDKKYNWPQRVEWLEEIVRRAASAPLWIYGYVRQPPPPTPSMLPDPTQYFIRLLAESWGRIEVLSISICIESDDKQILNNIQKCFLRRTPNLKIFHVYFPTDFKSPTEPLFLDSLQPGSSSCLFADHAPLLQTIKAKDMIYKVDSPWLSNVRHIDPFPRDLSLKDIFGILQHTPVVEGISFTDVKDRFWSDTLPRVSLPRLSYMNVDRANLEVLAGILDHISPAARLDCLLINVFDSSSGIDPPNPLMLSSLKENLPRYIARYSPPIPPIAVVLSMGITYFTFSDISRTINTGVTSNFRFHLSYMHMFSERERLLASLLDVLAFTLGKESSVLLTSVTKMSLSRLEIHTPSISRLYSLLALFRQVEEIYVDEQYGHILSALSSFDQPGGNPQYVLFPKLHTVWLETIDTTYTRFGVRDDIHIASSCTGDLTQFFMRRKTIGFPVATFNLTGCDKSKYAQDLRDLEKVGGLEILWRVLGREQKIETRSYICGSGNPQKLRGLV